MALRKNFLYSMVKEFSFGSSETWVYFIEFRGFQFLNLASALDVDKKTRFEVLDQRRGIIKMLVACVLVYFVSYSPIQGIFLSG